MVKNQKTWRKNPLKRNPFLTSWLILKKKFLFHLEISKGSLAILNMFIFILFFNCALIFVFIYWTSAVRSTVNFKQHGSHARRRIFHEVWMISRTNIFFKEKYTIKQIDRSTKIKIIFCYVVSIELAGGGDKFYFFLYRLKYFF